MDDVESACVDALVLRNKRMKHCHREFSVHQFTSQRTSAKTFDELVEMLGPIFVHQDTMMRKCIPLEEKYIDNSDCNEVDESHETDVKHEVPCILAYRLSWLTLTAAHQVVVLPGLTSGLRKAAFDSSLVAPGFSHVRIVPNDAAGQQDYSRISRFPRPCIPALLHAHPAIPSSALKTSIKLRSVQCITLPNEAVRHCVFVLLRQRRTGGHLRQVNQTVTLASPHGSAPPTFPADLYCALLCHPLTLLPPGRPIVCVCAYELSPAWMSTPMRTTPLQLSSPKRATNNTGLVAGRQDSLSPPSSAIGLWALFTFPRSSHLLCQRGSAPALTKSDLQSRTLRQVWRATRGQQLPAPWEAALPSSKILLPKQAYPSEENFTSPANYIILLEVFSFPSFFPSKCKLRRHGGKHAKICSPPSHLSTPGQPYSLLDLSAPQEQIQRMNSSEFPCQRVQEACTSLPCPPPSPSHMPSKKKAHIPHPPSHMPFAKPTAAH
ncbi:hypothetical protein PR048_022298 [Dryococelus australis]|uniref:Uncharacterized protein n=1 Tax=Dryococelus australis TaxID=614101 RepID=A0ABQ9H0N9_9NEOP|nr:hypothetical protein PR048_022298 [Dryococelus australis]